MSIATLHRSSFSQTARPFGLRIPALLNIWSVNKLALTSILLAFLFTLYFLVPHVGVASVVFRFNMLYVIAVPAIAFVLSIISLRQINYTGERGAVLGYAALSITTLYFIVALAIPVVLIGLYFVYTFIL